MFTVSFQKVGRWGGSLIRAGLARLPHSHQALHATEGCGSMRLTSNLTLCRRMPPDTFTPCRQLPNF